MKYEINTSAKSLEVDITPVDSGISITSNALEGKLSIEQIQAGVYSVLLNNRSFVVGVCPDTDSRVNVNGTPLKVELLDAVHLHLRELGWDSMKDTKTGQIAAQIPGLITKIFHEVGDEVQEGEALFLMEAMKMENEIKSPVAGTIQKILVAEGKTVEKGTNIIEIG